MDEEPFRMVSLLVTIEIAELQAIESTRDGHHASPFASLPVFHERRGPESGHEDPDRRPMDRSLRNLSGWAHPHPIGQVEFIRKIRTLPPQTPENELPLLLSVSWH
jgi:hypothetical protein